MRTSFSPNSAGTVSRMSCDNSIAPVLEELNPASLRAVTMASFMAAEGIRRILIVVSRLKSSVSLWLVCPMKDHVTDCRPAGRLKM